MKQYLNFDYENCIGLRTSYNTKIYFAIGFDPQQDAIYSNILPHFQAIYK